MSYPPAQSHRNPGQIVLRLVLLGLCVASFFLRPVNSQSAETPGNPAAQNMHAVLRLDGPWRFQTGDQPAWANPQFDDTPWPTVVLSDSLSDQGIDTYNGYAWYRTRIQPQTVAALRNLAGSDPIELLLTTYSAGQAEVFIDGIPVGSTRGMADSPSMYRSPPLAAPLPPHTRPGPIVIAIRTWAGPDIPIKHGLLDHAEIARHSDAQQLLALAKAHAWNEYAISPLFIAFLFFAVAVLGLALYIAQRHRSEYLWLPLLCIPFVASGLADALFGIGNISLESYQVFNLWNSHLLMAVTLEFVLRFTSNSNRRPVRILQTAILLIPVTAFLHRPQFVDSLSIAAEIAFCTCIIALLYRAWRKGQSEAGVMLLPFFLAATADSLDSVLREATAHGWIPSSLSDRHFYLGPVEYDSGTITNLVFLTSIIAVVLYRFLKVSRDEQRTAAEIAAARSVQALLIPTQLPSNKHFMLESAYFPVNGVGGDFFQVLPLADDSLLIVVGDVSGKGLQAAMNASTLVGAVRNELAHEPATVLRHLNRVLLGAVPTQGKVPEFDAAPCFATCLCARIHTDGTMIVANAGHLSPYRDGRELELPPGLPLGVIGGIEYEQITCQLNTGERLVFLSDGVVEATNSHGELFGFERTQQLSNEPPRYIAQTAQRFGQNDDITVISLYVTSLAAGRSEQQAFAGR